VTHGASYFTQTARRLDVEETLTNSNEKGHEKRREMQIANFIQEPG
jgi:hypothetical protein